MYIQNYYFYYFLSGKMNVVFRVVAVIKYEIQIRLLVRSHDYFLCSECKREWLYINYVTGLRHECTYVSVFIIMKNRYQKTLANHNP